MSFFNNISGIYVERKKRTKFENIEKMTEVPYVKLPLKSDVQKIVNIGEYIKKGQVIARGKIVPSVHSPISGEVEEIIDVSDRREGFDKIIVIKNDFSEQTVEFGGTKIFDHINPVNFFEILKEKGIVGMGGGGYPTYLKLRTAYEKKVEILIVNACECEPYLTCDERLIQENAKEIIEGINIISSILNIKKIIIAIEDNKKEAVFELKKAIKISKKIEIVELKSKYPLGEERLLVNELLGIEILKDKFPLDYGCVVQNVATVFAIYEAIIHGKGLFDRIITVSGYGIKEAKNLKVKMGTTVEQIKEYLGVEGDVQKVVLGGPMTGKTVFDGNAIIEKNHSALLFLNKIEINPKKTEVCINCGICVNKCPVGLMPLVFEKFLEEKEYGELIEHNIMDCIECGVCTYVCPSNRPLMESIGFSKKIIKEVRNDS